MNAKKCLALLLSACMAASVLAGCKDGDRKPSSSSSTNSSTNSSTTGNIVWSDPDYYKADDDQDNDKGCKPKTYKVAVEVRGGAYTIDKKTPIEVNRGGDVEFTVTAAEGYYIQSVKIGDTEVIPNDEAKHSSYIVKMEKLCSNRTVTITLGVLTYGIQTTLYGPSEIAAAASVTPSNYTPKYGEEVTFTLKYTDDYALQKVEVVANDKTETVEVKNDTFTYKVYSDVIVNAYFEEPSIETVTLEGNLIKKDYVYGEQFDPNGLTLVYTWSNGKVERIPLEIGAIEPVMMNDSDIMTTSQGKAIEIKHKLYYPEHPILAYFSTLGITVTTNTVDENGNGESKYLTQAEFNAINDKLEEIAGEAGATANATPGIRSDLVKGDVSQVVDPIPPVNPEGNFESADEIIARLDMFADDVKSLVNQLEGMDNKGTDGEEKKVSVYINIKDASVAGKITLTMWAVCENA